MDDIDSINIAELAPEDVPYDRDPRLSWLLQQWIIGMFRAIDDDHPSLAYLRRYTADVANYLESGPTDTIPDDVECINVLLLMAKLSDDPHGTTTTIFGMPPGRA